MGRAARAKRLPFVERNRLENRLGRWIEEGVRLLETGAPLPGDDVTLPLKGARPGRFECSPRIGEGYPERMQAIADLRGITCTDVRDAALRLGAQVGG